MKKRFECIYFDIEELVPPHVYADRGHKAWELLDVRLLKTIDKLRRRYGEMTINNWKWQGSREWSGFRSSSSPYYSPYSQHTFGRAVDVIFKNTTAEKVRKDILADPGHDDFKLIYSMELGVDWLHIDCRNATRIKTFYP